MPLSKGAFLQANKDVQMLKKGSFGKRKSKRDMTFKEEVVSSNLIANDIQMISTNNITLEAVNINATNEKIAYAKNELNIVSKQYKEDELHHSSKSSFGGLIKNSYEYDNNTLKLKSSKLTASNMILDAKQININASHIKANEVSITAELFNLITD